MVNKLVGIVLCFAISPMALGEMVGSYMSEEECRLEVQRLSQEAGYADALYSVRSDGKGACEWTGIGVGKRTFIDAGIVSGSSRGFAEIHWVFGPAGSQIEITFFDPDGTVRYKESYARQ